MNMLLLLIFGPALMYLAISLPLALAGGLLRGSARGWQAWRGSRRGPMLSEPELNLRRASRGCGFAAVLLLAAVVYDANGGRAEILAAIRSPGDAGPVPLIFAGLLALCLVQTLIGAIGCWGLRKKELAVSAFVKLALGAGVTVYLARHYSVLRLRLDDGPALAAQAGFVIGFWCLVVAAARLGLLTLGGSGALRRILRHIGRRVGRLRPARPRSY
jgi:hypothetical protein